MICTKQKDRSYTPVTLQAVLPTFIGIQKLPKIVEAEILNFSKLLYVLTSETGKAWVSQVLRQKCASNYRRHLTKSV